MRELYYIKMHVTKAMVIEMRHIHCLASYKSESTAISTRVNWHLYSKSLGKVTFNEVNSLCCAGEYTGNLPPQNLLSSE